MGKRCMQDFGEKRLRKRDNLEDTDVGGSLI
jgi:hypothetical protein